MHKIGATLKSLRHKFIVCMEEDEGTDQQALAAFDRATNDLLSEIVDGAGTEAPANPKQPRKKRSPNKKKDNPPSGEGGSNDEG